MLTSFRAGDVVRVTRDAREWTVEGTDDDGRVRCVRLAAESVPETTAFDAAGLELVWRGEGQPAAFRPGDVVRFPSAGGSESMTVERCDGRRVCCLWWGAAGLLAHWFAAPVLCLVRPTHDAVAELCAGDRVRLRSGSPEMTVEQGGAGQVRCGLGTGAPAWLDARTLKIDDIQAHQLAADELACCARRQGISLASVCDGSWFLRDGRYVIFWRKTRNGVIYYSAQGAVKRLPEEFRHSANAFRGFWDQAGYCDGIEQAFAFLRAWVLDRREVDELPERRRLRYGIG